MARGILVKLTGLSLSLCKADWSIGLALCKPNWPRPILLHRPPRWTARPQGIKPAPLRAKVALFSGP